MGELVVTIPTSRAGAIAREQLASNASLFECSYRYSLTDYLRDLESATYLEQLPFSFHLVSTEDGKEEAVAHRILAWHSGERREWPHGRVAAAESNFPLYLSGLGLPFTLGGHHGPYLGQMKVTAAHQTNVKGAGVRVGVLDSGLDSSPTVNVNLRDFYDVHNAANLHPAPPAPVDVDGHGTAMATLIHEIAPDADVYVIRVLDTGTLNLWKLMAGVAVAISACDADIINLSLGFTSFGACSACGAPRAVRALAFEALADTATPGSAKQPVFVAATGNSGLSTGFEFPASSAKCLAVGSVDSASQRSSFSNYGSTHAHYLMAPGGQKSGPGFTEDVGTGQLNACAGTSVSAAYVSGMLALFRSEARYAILGRDSFITSILNNHCVMPQHAAGNVAEYGAGVIEYSPPVAPGGGATPAGQTVGFDGRYVYVGGVRLEINKRY